MGGVNFYTWGSTAQMVADAQSWLDESDADYGWILIGNEGASDGEEVLHPRGRVGGQPPPLTITFTPPPPPQSGRPERGRRGGWG